MGMSVKDNSIVQKTIDGFIDKIFLRFIPHSVRPNQVTAVRFILIPVICLLFAIGRLDTALVVFVIAASTDFIDGAMARTRNQITDVGKVIDPIADKLLILSVLWFIGFRYLIVKIFVIVIVLELSAILLSVFFSFALGRPIGANVFGKIKMVLQSFSIGLFILGILVKSVSLIHASEIILFIALVFAIVSYMEQAKLKLLYFLKKRPQSE
jgi:CDP-diacylglycerol--glycerol-3-phosphate 3-phosphatidyltransferase